MWPVKWLLMRSGPSNTAGKGAENSTTRAFFFGDTVVAAEQLAMTNRLSGYVFLLDREGRIRWRQSGQMLAAEDEQLIQALKHCLVS